MDSSCERKLCGIILLVNFVDFEPSERNSLKFEESCYGQHSTINFVFVTLLTFFQEARSGTRWTGAAASFADCESSLVCGTF